MKKAELLKILSTLPDFESPIISGRTDDTIKITVSIPYETLWTKIPAKANWQRCAEQPGQYPDNTIRVKWMGWN